MPPSTNPKCYNPFFRFLHVRRDQQVQNKRDTAIKLSWKQMETVLGSTALEANQHGVCLLTSHSKTQFFQLSPRIESSVPFSVRDILRLDPLHFFHADVITAGGRGIRTHVKPPLCLLQTKITASVFLIPPKYAS